MGSLCLSKSENQAKVVLSMLTEALLKPDTYLEKSVAFLPTFLLPLSRKVHISFDTNKCSVMCVIIPFAMGHLLGKIAHLQTSLPQDQGKATGDHILYGR